jgi:hypothetical protein
MHDSVIVMAMPEGAQQAAPLRMRMRGEVHVRSRGAVGILVVVSWGRSKQAPLRMREAGREVLVRSRVGGRDFWGGIVGGAWLLRPSGCQM